MENVILLWCISIIKMYDNCHNALITIKHFYKCRYYLNTFYYKVMIINHIKTLTVCLMLKFDS